MTSVKQSYSSQRITRITRELPSDHHLEEDRIDYYPLQSGYFWEYQGTYRLLASNLPCPYESRSHEREQVARITPCNRGHMLTLAHQIVEEDGEISRFETNYQLNGRQLSDAEGRAIYLQMPLTLNSKWEWLDVDGNRHEVCVEGLASLQVPAGHFPHVLKVVDYTRNAEEKLLSLKTEWYALNIGKIKTHLLCTHPVTHGRMEETRELVNYSLQSSEQISQQLLTL